MEKAYHSSSPGVSANGSVSCRSSGSAKSQGRAGASRTAVARPRTATRPPVISICPGCSRHLVRISLDRALLHVPRGSMRWPVVRPRNRDRHLHHNRYPSPSRAPKRTGLRHRHLARRPHHIRAPHPMRRSSREHSSPSSTTSSWASRSAYSASWNGIVWRAGRSSKRVAAFAELSGLSRRASLRRGSLWSVLPRSVRLTQKMLRLSARRPWRPSRIALLLGWRKAPRTGKWHPSRSCCSVC